MDTSIIKSISDAVTAQKISLFVNEMLKQKNGATFQRRINKVIVRACFKVHTQNYKHLPVYTLMFASDDNAAKMLIDYHICRDVELHGLIKDFKRIINDYMCSLAV